MSFIKVYDAKSITVKYASAFITSLVYCILFCSFLNIVFEFRIYNSLSLASLDQYITKLFTKFNNQNTLQNAIPEGLADRVSIVVSNNR